MAGVGHGAEARVRGMQGTDPWRPAAEAAVRVPPSHRRS